MAVWKLALLTGAVLAPLAAQAQRAESEQQGTPEQASVTGSAGVGDIIVTATRRQSSIADVPIAITAMSQAALDDRGIRNVSDLSRITPGLSFTPAWGGSTRISIRGISSTVGAGTTGIYVDDTPIQVRTLGAGNTSSNAYPAIFDVERVEVLRGPQGTLFGAGSEGGAVRFITPEPSLNKYSGYMRAEQAFTQHGDPTNEVGAAIGGPIVNDKLGFRISGFYRRDGGWIDRVDPLTGAQIDKNSNALETISLRGALQFAPTDRLKITPAILYQEVKGRDSNQIWRNLSDPANDVFKSGQALRQPSLDRYLLYSLAATWDLGPASLISNTSYFDRKNPLDVDYTAYAAELLGGDYLAAYRSKSPSVAAMNNRQKVFTQEVRLQSNGAGRLKWVLGLFYQDAKQYATEDVHITNGDGLTQALFGTTVEGAFGIPLVQPGNVIYYGYDQSRDKQIAGFGQLDFSLTEQLTLTAGLRVARTKFRSSNVQGGPFNGEVTRGSSRQSETPVTPKFGIEYKPDRDLMLYASVAKGFRTGGGNNPVPVLTCGKDLAALGLSGAPADYKSDSVWSYEAGVKGAAFNRRLRIETSAFYIDWQNIQASIPLNSCGFTFIGNLGAARSRGFDLHITAAPVRGLTLEAAVGYTDAKYKDTVYGGVLRNGSRSIVISKNDPLFVAPWTVSLSGDYETDLASGAGISGYLHGEYNYGAGWNYGRVATIGYDPLDTSQAATHVAALRVGVRKDGIDASLFVNNLFNSRDRLAVSHDPISSALFRDVIFRPRTIGATISYRY